MSKFVVVVFPDETKAYEGVHALQELHREANATVYGTTVVRREANGSLLVVQSTDQGPLAFGVGALVRGLVGFFGTPAGAVVNDAAGESNAASRDDLHAEVSDDFLSDLGRELQPGNFAVVAEVSEEWTAPIDTRMEELGGKIVRVRRKDFTADLIQKGVEATRAELDQWKAERAEIKASALERKLEKQIDDARAELQRTADTARLRLDRTKEELDAKLEALEEQAAKAKPEIRSRIEQRISELRKDFSERAQKLTRAYDLTQEALHA